MRSRSVGSASETVRMAAFEPRRARFGAAEDGRFPPEVFLAAVAKRKKRSF